MIPGFTMEHFSDQDTQKNINTAMLEAIAKFDKDSRWVGTGRFEQQMIPAAGGAVALNSTQVALNLAYYVNQNARIALDWTHQSQDQGGPKIDQVQAFVHVAY